MPSREYSSPAQTLRRVAESVSDQAVADRLKVLAESYERRAEMASQADPGKN
jgi:hypothetical protein